jgi:microcystin-dependent protein
MALDFPNNPVNGQAYDNYYWDATSEAWRTSGVITPKIPAGVISQYAGDTAPDGYLLCTGQSLATTEYPALFAAIGYAYGGSGGSFSVPNLQNRIPVGKGNETEFDALGEVGGAKTHVLTTSEMPSHTHTQDSHNHTQMAHSHTGTTNQGYGWPFSSQIYVSGGSTNFHPITWGGALVGSDLTYQNRTLHTHAFTSNDTTATNNAATATNQNTGGGLAHNNLQPYIVLNYIIKT